jgi:hypothetical protein
MVVFSGLYEAENENSEVYPSDKAKGGKQWMRFDKVNHGLPPFLSRSIRRHSVRASCLAALLLL